MDVAIMRGKLTLAERATDARHGLINTTGSHRLVVIRDRASSNCVSSWAVIPLAVCTVGLARVPRMNAPSSTTPASTDVLPVEQYVAGLARKRMATGVLFRDTAGRVLLVEPSYKPNWEIPGGAVEADESPWATATRELAEELGWDRPIGRLLVVDYVRPQDSRPEGVVFVFDGGVLDETDVVGMMFPDAEILSAGFHALPEARAKMKPLLANRLSVALDAVEQGVTALCEQGRRIA
jgi:8-oxo-dGTP pyrophosphatase MutT (NUDIX family)